MEMRWRSTMSGILKSVNVFQGTRGSTKPQEGTNGTY